MTAPDIFVSYNREDAATAKRYADVCSPNFIPKSSHSAFHHPMSDLEHAGWFPGKLTARGDQP